MSNTEIPLGVRVEVPAGHGVVRFSGTASFAPGKWVGIELDESKGKNDGSVQGIRYFNCKILHGVFVRPSQVKIITTVSVMHLHDTNVFLNSFVDRREMVHHGLPTHLQLLVMRWGGQTLSVQYHNLLDPIAQPRYLPVLSHRLE